MALDPDNSGALHALGTIAYQSGRIQEAIALIGRAIELDPFDPAYHTNLGLAYHAGGKAQAALACWRSALSLDPSFPEANTNLGMALYEQGELEAGLALLRKALEAAPACANALNNLGVALGAAGAREEALSCFHQAVILQPDHALTHMNAGNLLRTQGRLQEAIASYRRAVVLAPGLAPAYYNLGKGLSDFGMLEEAVASYATAVELSPESADAWNSLGIVLWELGRADEAIKALRTALALSPRFAKAWFNLHTLVLDTQNLANAIDCLRQVIEIDPEDREARFFLGMLLDYGGNPAAAAPHLDLASVGPVWVRASLDSYRYIRSCSPRPRLIGSSLEAFQTGLENARGDGLVLEFGVRFGTSIRQIASLVNQDVHGFDSFEGLPEAWHEEPRGSYSTLGALPSVPENVHLHRGWFEATLPPFLQRNEGPVRFMNVDCDLYSSTWTVLQLLAERIGPGTVLAFDEYLGHEHWREDEFRAFQEAVRKYGWSYEYVAFSICTRQAVVLIK